jgi:virulence-associated protein VagC
MLTAIIGLSPAQAVTLPAEVASHTLTVVLQHVPEKDVLEPVFKQVLDAASRQVSEGDEDRVRVVLKAIEVLVGVKKGGKVPSEC